MDFHRKDAKNAKKSRKMKEKNPQYAKFTFVAIIGYPGIERLELSLLVVVFPSCSLRLCGERV
jgi:hypothetical protein